MLVLQLRKSCVDASLQTETKDRRPSSIAHASACDSVDLLRSVPLQKWQCRLADSVFDRHGPLIMKINMHDAIDGARSEGVWTC